MTLNNKIATYVSIKETRISFALNLTLRKAGIAPQKSPPMVPPRSTRGMTQKPSTPQNARATAPPQSPPITSCPSAPMFQTPARNPSAKATPMVINGVAFASNSLIPYTEFSGLIKIRCKLDSGSSPIAANKTETVSSVKINATKTASHS